MSLGVQALNDPDLRRLGRMHSVDEALAAVKIAASIFERYSFDLIYSRPDQTPKPGGRSSNAPSTTRSSTCRCTS